jgi:hypothetical protein
MAKLMVNRLRGFDFKLITPKIKLGIEVKKVANGKINKLENESPNGFNEIKMLLTPNIKETRAFPLELFFVC